MSTPGKPTIVQRFTLGPALALVLAGVQPALADDTASERTQLAALVRQLDMLHRLAEHSASLPRQDRSRYHFDYARLREDIERVREGIQDYLSPQRAQPRDPVKLVGGYRRESAEEDSP
ncbi:MAG: RAQPRD family integrative conjugative element protein [Gammaproteobacteria bacterium]